MLAAALMLLVSDLPSARADDFQAWVARFWPTAKAAGITRQTYDLAFKNMTPDPKVVEAANFQPEYVKPIGEYIDRVVSDKRIETG
jgi:membrane-bound lytic murein transglycosylase B